MLKLVVLAVVLGAALASDSNKNKCPWVMGKYPFDEAKFAGEWTVIAGDFKGKDVRCGKVNYKLNKDSHMVEVKGIKEGKPFAAESYGQPIFGKPEKSANSMAVYKKEDGSWSSVYKQAVVATDYENYAVLIACKPVFNPETKTFSRDLKAKIFSRKQSLSADTLEVLKNVISGYDIDPATLQLVDNSNC